MVKTSEKHFHATDLLDRKHLIDVLLFLERRGASQEVIALAIQRAGIEADVAWLLARCMTGMAASPGRSRSSVDTGRASARILRSTLRIAVVWVLLFGSALLGGVAIGYDFGLTAGFDAGLDRIALALNEPFDAGRW